MRVAATAQRRIEALDTDPSSLRAGPKGKTGSYKLDEKPFPPKMPRMRHHQINLILVLLSFVVSPSWQQVLLTHSSNVYKPYEVLADKWTTLVRNIVFKNINKVFIVWGMYRFTSDSPALAPKRAASCAPPPAGPRRAPPPARCIYTCRTLRRSRIRAGATSGTW